MSKSIWCVLGLSLMLSACISQEQRGVNRSEDTILSKEVQRLLAENDGILDIREHPTVGCVRVRLVGSHMVKRFCYTNQEEKDAAHANQNSYYESFGPQQCLDQGSVACQAGMEGPGQALGAGAGPG